MKKSDYYIININNNGCGYIQTETESFECSANFAECVLSTCIRNGMAQKFFKRFENNDVQYIYN